MEIEEFVSSVLCGIVKGAVSADKEVSKLGAEINPALRNAPSDVFLSTLERGEMVCRAEFDIALTVENKEGAGAKIGVFSGIFGTAASGNLTNANTHMTRIKFSIPYSLPKSSNGESPSMSFVRHI